MRRRWRISPPVNPRSPSISQEVAHYVEANVYRAQHRTGDVQGSACLYGGHGRAARVLSALLGNYCTRTVMYAYSGMPENKEDRYNKTRGRLKAGLHLAKIQW